MKTAISELLSRGSLFLLVFATASLSLLNTSCSRSKGYKKERVEMGRAQTDREREDIVNTAKNFGAPKKRSLVLNFWNDTPIKGPYSRNAKEAMKHYLASTQQINIVNDKNVRRDSQSFFLDKKKVNVGALVEMGQKWGVSLIFLGRLNKIVFRKMDEQVGLLRPSAARAAVTLELHLIDVVSGKHISSGEGVGIGKLKSLNLFASDSEDNGEVRLEIVRLAIQDAIRKAMPLIKKEIYRIQWRGKLAKIVGNRYYLNAGRATGLNLGDILQVTTSGSSIYDPDTGLFIGRAEGEVKGTIEVQKFFGEDGAIGRLHSGGNFLENDIVQLYH